jgi:hypothetical protein
VCIEQRAVRRSSTQPAKAAKKAIAKAPKAIAKAPKAKAKAPLSLFLFRGLNSLSAAVWSPFLSRYKRSVAGLGALHQ